jgi:hypothetical protein
MNKQEAPRSGVKEPKRRSVLHHAVLMPVFRKRVVESKKVYKRNKKNLTGFRSSIIVLDDL